MEDELVGGSSEAIFLISSLMRLQMQMGPDCGYIGW